MDHVLEFYIFGTYFTISVNEEDFCIFALDDNNVTETQNQPLAIVIW